MDTLFDEIYITITGFDHYYGIDAFEIGAGLSLVKEPGNRHDTEAIAVHAPVTGKVGYVANTPYTMVRGCLSAGRLYDFFAQECVAVVRFMTDKMVIAKVFPNYMLDISVELEAKENLTKEEQMIQDYLDLLRRSRGQQE